MFGYEKLPIFDNVESRITLRAIAIATRRAKLYTKPSVLFKEIALFCLITFIALTVGFNIEGVGLGLIMLGAPLSIYILKNEFNKFVVPLLPKALEDAKKFPTMDR